MTTSEGGDKSAYIKSKIRLEKFKNLIQIT